MKIAILSQGPSLAAHLEARDIEAADVTIGVNHVVERWPCDWWAFCDRETFVTAKPIGRPRAWLRRFSVEPEFHEGRPCQGRSAWQQYDAWPKVDARKFLARIPDADQGPDLPCWDVTGPDGQRRRGTKPIWNTFGGLSALGLAWCLLTAWPELQGEPVATATLRPRPCPPDRLALYGYDLGGEGGACDADHACARNRTLERWKMEGSVFDWWLRMFAKLGVEVERR